MPLFGKIVVIKRNGADGIHFPLTACSCLFGRKTECDIRIQLPQVSKEHCKIEVNENKEAILTNLSNVNPTQLNSSSFQQPVHLKHGDILTIVDRSFRFEYPAQSTPRKRCSRSPKSETLQVLHVQQVAEVESLLTETARSKGPHGSDDSECEGQNAGQNKQSTEENITRPKSAKKPATPKSACRTPKSIKKENKMSPFSQIYEYLKHENEINNSQSEDNMQQQTRISRCLPGQGSQIKMDAIIREDAKGCKVKQNIHGLKHNQFTTEQNGLEKRFSGNHRTVVSNQKPIDLEEKNDLPLQDSAETYEQNVSRKSEVTKCIAIKLKRVSDQKTAFSPKSCTIESLGDIAQVLTTGTPIKHSTEAANEDSLTSISETTEYSASTPRSRRKGRRSHSSSSTRETNETSSISTDTSLTGQDFLLMLKQSTEIQSEIQKEGVVCKSDGNELCVLAEINKNSKQKRNCKLLTPIKSLSAEDVVKEIHDETYFASEGRDSEIHTPSPGKSSFQSTRRSGSRNKELQSKSCLHSEMLSPEKVATKGASPTICKSHCGTRRGRPRTSGQQIEKALERDTSQEHDRSVDSDKKELAAKSCQQKLDLEDASIMPRCHTLSSKRCSESIVLKDDEILSEMSACGLSAKIEESGELKRSPQKRKSGNGDLSLQPLGKRKRVSFGGHLSPELFDKSLPPNSPLKRGAIPARLSLPFGNSPRAVLKKAQGFKRCVIKELSERLQKKKLSPKHSPARRSPAASPPARKSPAASPVLENTSSKLSDHQISVPTTPKQVTRQSARFTAKRTPGKRRSGAVAAVHAKRRSGASDANLLVAKSWAEVVKLGIARPQVRTAKKYVQKGRRVKKLKLPKTPERKVKGQFSTGHADSPATIMIGRAHTTTVKIDYGQAPKVVKNSALKLCMDINESFTGMPEMFKIPVNRDEKGPSLTSGQKTDLSPMYTAMEVSELLTPEESGEMAVSPLNISSSAKQKQVNQEVVSHFLKREKSSDSDKDKAIMKKKTGTKPLIIAENKINEVTLGARSQMNTPKQETEPLEPLSGAKKTPEEKMEPVETLAGVRRSLRTPKQKAEPTEALSGVKRLMRTPKQKTQPVDALSGVKRLMRTPKQKTQPVDALSGVRRLMRTPKQKTEPVVDDIAYKRLFETPEECKQVGNNVCGVSVTKATAKVKYQPVKDMKGISCMMKTPKEIVRPIEDMFGISRLLRTPREKYLPVDDFVGLQKFLAEPKQKRSDSELDYVGVKEMFDTPEEKVPSTEVTDLSQKKVFPCTDSRNERREEKSSLCNSSEKLFLSLRKRTGGQENLEMLDSIVPAERNRVKTERNKQCSTDEPCSKERSQRPRRNTRRAETAKCMQRDEDDFTKNLIEAVPMEELENKKAKIKVTKKKGEALKRNSRKQLAETEEVVKMDSDSVGNIQEIKRTSNETAVKTQAPLEETEAGNKDVGTDQNCKSNYLLSENANEVPLNVYNLQANTNPVKESNPRCRNNRGKKGVIVSKENEFSKNVNGKEASQTKDRSIKNINDQDFIMAQTADTYSLDSLSDSRKEQHAAQVAFSGTNSLNESQCGFEREISSEEIIPQMKSDIESQKTATKKSSRTEKTSKTKKDQKDSTTAGVQIVKEESTVLRLRSTRRSNKEQEAPKTNHNEILENNPTESKENTLRRGKGKKVQFQVKESSSISLRGKHAVPEGDNKEANHEDGQNETSKKIPAQANGRRGQRKQVDLVLQAATSSSVTGNSILLEDPSKDETATSSIKQNSLRSWKREVVFTSQMANSTSLRRKHDLLEGNDKEETLQKDEKVVLENTASQTKVSASTRGRGKKAHFTQQATSSFSLRGKHGLTKSNDKNEIANEDQGAGLEMSAASTEEIPTRRGRRKNVALVSQEARSTLLQTKCVLPTNGVNEEILKEDQNIALGNTTAQTRANSARREKIKKSDFTQQVASSPSVGGKCGLERNGVDTSEDQNVALETVPSARENLSRRGRRKNAVILAQTNNFTSQGGKCDLLTANVTEKVPVEDQNKALENTSEAKAGASARGRRRKADLVEQATSSLSHRGKRGLPKNDGKEEISDNQNIILETVPFSSEIPPRRGRRKGVVPLSQATSSTSQREKCSLSESNDQEDTHKENKNVALENAPPPEKSNPLKKKGKKKMDLLSPAAGSTVPHNQFSLPENDGKRETPKGDQNMPLEITSSAKGKSSGRGRKKKTDASTLRKTDDLPKDSGQEESLKEDKNVALENALSHRKPDLSRRKRNKKIEVISQADNSPLFQDKTRLPEDDIKEVVYTEDQNVVLEHTTAKEIILRKGKKKEIILPSQAASSAPLGRKRHLPEDERAAKKVKSGESGESRTLLRGRRNKTQERNDKEDASLIQTGIERRTRASTRTRK
uniref:Marker of proliferation Ki-67 n=1 Tax=Crocodylus porosus TaxID=8502 RepID=A0A7M4EQT6_CROPO